jgi:hypothetical protein
MLLLLFGLAIAELCTPSRLNIPGDARSVLTLRYAIFSVDERSSGPCGVYAVEYATGETTRLSTACGADIISFEKPSFWAFRADGVIHLVENNNTLLIGALTYPGLRSMTWGGGLFLICTSNVDACIFRQGHQNGTDVGLIVVESGHVDAQIGSLFFRRLLSSNPTMEPLFFSADNRFVWCLSDNARRLSVIWLFDSTEVQIQIPGGRGGVLSSPQRLGNSVVFVATDAPRVFIQAFTDGRVRMFNDVQASIPDFAIVQNWIPYSASNGMTVVLVSGSNRCETFNIQFCFKTTNKQTKVLLRGKSSWPACPNQLLGLSLLPCTETRCAKDLSM